MKISAMPAERRVSHLRVVEIQTGLELIREGRKLGSIATGQHQVWEVVMVRENIAAAVQILQSSGGDLVVQ